MRKTLVVADDFGFSENVNRACIDAFEKGSVTELSLMVDAWASEEAAKYIKDNNVEDVGLHFSLMRISKDGKTPKGSDYDDILETWSADRLENAFDEEVALFRDLVGYIPKHIIGHKQISLHPKILDHVASYCVKNNCYARKEVKHATLKLPSLDKNINIGRTADSILGFRYGSPEEMYRGYKSDIQKLRHSKETIEILFHPGYADDFERQHTSFIQERIDDINFLLSDYFAKLVAEEELQLVSSKEL